LGEQFVVGGVVHTVLIRIAVCSFRVNKDSPIVDPMADFLAVLGFLGFALVMLALIWALDRV